jgi:hypothetical protein
MALLALSGVALCWPAFYNRYPLLYPDSIDYLISGPDVARAFLSHQGFPGWYAHRSLVYGLAILPFHARISPWPILAFQAALTLWILRLTLRTAVGASDGAVLAVTLLLTASTSIPWFVGYVMPDIFAPITILGTYLLAFQWPRLSGGQRSSVALVLWFSLMSHTSHLVLAGVLIPVVVLVLVLGRRPWLAVAARLATVLGMAAVTLMALHAYLHGSASLTGQRAPFLLARVIADGPGRWYLQSHCDHAPWAICAYAKHLPESGDIVTNFLWEPGSIWTSANRELKQRLVAQEGAVVMAAVRAYPYRQLRASGRNFLEQLDSYGLRNYYPNAYIEKELDKALPDNKPLYLRSRQAGRDLQEKLFASAQKLVVWGALGLIGLLNAFRWRKEARRLGGLTAVIVCGLLGNAAICGVLSNVEDRYQSRVIWLLPLLACVLCLALFERPGRAPHVPPHVDPEHRLSSASAGPSASGASIAARRGAAS